MRKQIVLTERFGKMQDPSSIDEYRFLNGYKGLEKAIEMGPEKALDEIDIANLRGRGGAAYPMGKKWRHLYNSPDYPKYIVCNADEGEPGTFKDRALFEKDPLAIIEGMTIAGWLFGSQQGYIYCRVEYQILHSQFDKALKNAREAGLLGKNIMGIQGFDYDIKLVSGAGAYICGENSALLNSIEGKTGRPRTKPPHLADVGLYQKPTLVNNVESFAGVPVIMREGGQNYLDLGTPEGGGTKLICLSGHVKNRGLYEVNLGTPLEEILYSDEYGGGSSTGRPLKFIHFGGQSGPIGAVKRLEHCIYSYDGMWDVNLAIGSGAIVVMDDSVSIIDYLLSVANFFAHESCGKCTPCRIGSMRIVEMLETMQTKKVQPGEFENYEKLLNHVKFLSACGLGQSIPVSIQSAWSDFPEEFEACIDHSSAQAQEVLW